MEIPESSVEELRRGILGSVIRRNEPGFREEVIGSNTAAVTNPEFVVGAASEADVQAAVRWARRHGLTVHPQATGHGAHRELNHGLMLTTHRLKHLSVDRENGTFTLGAGLCWGEILPTLHSVGLGAVTGSAATVGAVGLVLGGGIGPIGRTFGMAADWVLGFRMVDADGSVLVVNPESHDDLFWALRGGKVGLGVVTEMTVQALQMPYLYAGGIYYPESEISRLLHFWSEWVRDLPDTVSTSASIVRLPEDYAPPLGDRTWFHLRFAYVNLGATSESYAEEGERILASWREFAGEGEWENIQVLTSDRVAEIHRDPTEPVPLWTNGNFLRELPHDLIDGVLAHVGTGISAPFSNVEIRYHGAAYRRVPKYPSAVGGRQELYTFNMIGHPDGEEVTERSLDAAAEPIVKILTPSQGDEVNYNWANPMTKETFDRLWSPAVRERLDAIRRTYDPFGVFEYEHSTHAKKDHKPSGREGN